MDKPSSAFQSYRTPNPELADKFQTHVESCYNKFTQHATNLHGKKSYTSFGKHRRSRDERQKSSTKHKDSSADYRSKYINCKKSEEVEDAYVEIKKLHNFKNTDTFATKLQSKFKHHSSIGCVDSPKNANLLVSK